MIWLNGLLIEPEVARIDPDDRGFLLGDGVFETVLATDGVAHHMDRHLARMREGASVLGIDPAWQDAAILRAAHDVLRACGLDEAVLRLTLTRGPGPRGILPRLGLTATLLIAAWPWLGLQSACGAVTSARTRRNQHSPLCRIKSLNYLDSIIARREAAASGADEAILLNTHGHVAEASAGNLFLLAGGDWVTPPAGDGALPGIARALILEAGLATERRIDPAALHLADAAFVSSSLAIRPLSSIDGCTLGHPQAALLVRLEALLRLR